MKLAVCFTNFGPYHLARLQALSARLRAEGGRLIAYETAGVEAKYPWRREVGADPFEAVTLFPDAVLEDLSAGDCRRAIAEAFDRDRPDVVAAVGYVRPESLELLRRARKRGVPTILMSESQVIDRPRVWWKEKVKRARLRLVDAALVGGPSHRDYLVELGIPADRIALGYNAVDNQAHAARAEALRGSGHPPEGIPSRPYFLSASRFVTEKNVPTLVRAFGRYRSSVDGDAAWDLVLCGNGPARPEIVEAIDEHGLSGSVHLPGFLQEAELAPWLAFASGFVLASRSEPWGLVVNEAAACGLPLLVTEVAGCAGTLVPDPPGTTGWRFGPEDEPALADRFRQLSGMRDDLRLALGRRAAEVVAAWGPERFAEGTLEAIRLARGAARARRGPGVLSTPRRVAR